MKREKNTKNVPQLIAVFLHLLLLAAVLLLMQHVRELLYSDAKINMTEVVTQHKEVITSKLQTEINRLAFISLTLEDRMEQGGGIAAMNDVFLKYAEDYNELTIYIADENGMAFFPNGDRVDISTREYFQLALKGVRNISNRTISWIDGKDVFTMSVPLQYKDKTIGTLQKLYTPEDLYELCSLSLFSSQGDVYIINNKGEILIDSHHTSIPDGAERNYYNMLEQCGNSMACCEMKEDLQNSSTGFVEIFMDDSRRFLAYMPIAGIYDWCLVSSIETNVITSNASVVIAMFYGILLTILLVFGISIFYFLHYKDKQRFALESIAFIDSVTQGDTYTRFSMKLRETFKKNTQKQYYLVVLDIDNFKYVNNFYGFDYGDQLLRKIHQTICSFLHPAENIARVYSDHFVLLLEDASSERLTSILHATESDDEVQIFFSAGVYAIRDPEENLNQMLDKATIASRTAKGTVHNKIAEYSEQFDNQLIKNEHMKRLVAEGLVNDEMIPFFQPKVDVNTKILVGAEALARWKRSDGTMVQPFEFIPMCEQTGQIVDVDMAIFEKTLRFLRRNLDKGVQCVPISVNFSRLHLSNEDFLKTVADKIELYQIPPQLLEMELTESIIFGNHELIAKFTAQLHELGLVISMDDFGSGYSSLNMLKDIPIDVLKIDQGFLRETTNSNRQRIIFSAIAQMAAQLKIRVVVEGVETLENVEMMKEYGCFVAQGYFYARPMSEEDFEVLYKKGVL